MDSLFRDAHSLVVILDAKGAIIGVNPFFERLTGYSLEAVQGRNWFDTFLPECDRARIRTVFATAMSGTPTRGNVNGLLTRGGEVRMIEWFDAALTDARGKPEGLYCIGTDVTDRLRIEQALRDREARLAAILQTAEDAIITIDERGIVESVNPATERMFGYPARELLGRNISILMPGPLGDEHDGYLARYRATGERRIIGVGRSVNARCRDGTILPVDLKVAEFKVGERRCFSAILRDLTERTEIQAGLCRAERLAAIGELAAGVVHEVGNPITTIINSARMMREGDADPGLVDDILAEAGRIAAMTRGLLGFARDQREEPVPTGLREIVDRALHLLGFALRKRRIRVEVDLDPALPPMLAMPQKMLQIFINLLSNARDALATEEGNGRPAISIRGELAELDGKPAVRMRVRDNGPGISEDVRARLSHAFVTTKASGTGLGLPVCRRIVEEHGGTLAVDSVVGEFAEFVVTVPAWAAASDSRGDGKTPSQAVG